MKPKPLSTLNHFTVPVSSTDVPEDAPLDVVARTPDRGGVVGVAVLASTLRTSVTVALCVQDQPGLPGCPQADGADAPLSEN